MPQSSPLHTVAVEGGGLHLTGRRWLFAALAVATGSGVLALAVCALSPGGWSGLDVVLIALLAVTLPWMIAGFWNAAIGFLILRFSADTTAAVYPLTARLRGDEPINGSTAILLCIRNESSERVVRNIEPLLSGLNAAGVGGRFHLYVLSDTNNPAIAAVEEALFASLAARWKGCIPVIYRRRTVNTGYKAGNIRDFCERWGANHDFAVTLDADSVMTAPAVLRLLRVIQADSKLGILQALVVGLPSTSCFARLFQFGMRLGMRSYTVGSAWWQGDCGPYWGHNAILRLEPFIAHCRLPSAMHGSVEMEILSHDQIEAAMMRAAGYDVRVLPEEDLGWEENPPTLLEFVRRDLRWCQGNMQYWRFLRYPGFRAVSRYQLVLAILMFLGSPAWIALLALGTLGVALAPTPSDFIEPNAGLALFGAVLTMWFAPRIATALEVLSRKERRRSFGGVVRFIANVMLDTVFSILLCPILWFGHTIFLIGLLFGREIGWIGQSRDDHAISPGLALANFWPHTLLGCAVLNVLAMKQPTAIPFALFLAGGPVLSIPFAIITAWPPFGRLCARIGVGRLPEETLPPDSLHALALPALAGASPTPRPSPV